MTITDAGDVRSFVSVALAQIGKPYMFGSSDISSFDCSSLVQYAADTAGLAGCPRNSAAQYDYGTAVTRDELSIGDLIFFDFEYPPQNVRHVGIYIGDGQMVNAQSEQPAEVCTASIDEGYWSTRIIGYRRIFQEMTEKDIIEAQVIVASSATSDVSSHAQTKAKPKSVLM